MYHVNPTTGEGAICRAARGRCPFGEELHGLTLMKAQVAYENFVAKDNDPDTNELQTFSKKKMVNLGDLAGTYVDDTPPKPKPEVSTEEGFKHTVSRISYELYYNGLAPTEKNISYHLTETEKAWGTESEYLAAIRKRKGL